MNVPPRYRRSTGLIWLGPLAFLLHDSEEVATVESWLRQHRAELPAYAQPLAGVTATQFATVAAALLAAYALAAWHGVRAIGKGRTPLPFLVMTGVFVSNGLTHLLQVLYFRAYTPGAWTAALMSVPYGIALWRLLPSSGIASRALLGSMILVGFGIQLILAVLVFSLSAL